MSDTLAEKQAQITELALQCLVTDGQAAEALARAEKAEADLTIERRMCDIHLGDLARCEVRADRAEALLKEVAEIVAKSCQKCGGEGWLWGYELSDPPDVIGHDDTRYSCDGDLHKCADAILARAAELEGKTDE